MHSPLRAHPGLPCPALPVAAVCYLLCLQLSASLGQLTKLEMPKAAGVTFQGVLSGFPALRRLDLSRCDQLNSAALPAALESLECLESVSLDNCTLTTLKLSMSQLKVGPCQPAWLACFQCPLHQVMHARECGRLCLGPVLFCRVQVWTPACTLSWNVPKRS